MDRWKPDNILIWIFWSMAVVFVLLGVTIGTTRWYAKSRLPNSAEHKKPIRRDFR